MPIEPDSEKAAYDTAIGLLARREHATLELHHKLTHRGYDNAVVNTVLQQLVDDGYLSDRRFAEVYANSRADKGYGPLRIRQELRERGVDDDIVAIQLEQLDDFWPKKLIQVQRKKFASNNPKDFAEQAKQMRFLRHRGYTLDQINILFRDIK